MYSGGELHIQPLLNRLEQVHDQMIGDVKPAQRKNVFVCRPVAFHQLDVESLLLEETILDRAEYRSFAGDTYISNPDLRQMVTGAVPRGFALITASR